MVKELATILKSQLNNIAFLEVIAGIVQPVIDVKFQDDGGVKFPKKIPVSYDTSKGKTAFLGSERQLVPDKNYKSILYFEDFGSQSETRGRANTLNWNTNLRLVCWMNKTKLGYAADADITMKCMDQVLHRLVKGVGFNQLGITKLFVTASRVVQQDAAIFSRYNYDEAELQYLRPPYEYFAIDLNCRYEAKRIACMGEGYTSNIYRQCKITINIKDTPDASVKQTLDNGWVLPLEYPSGGTLTVPALAGYTILAGLILTRSIVDPIPYDANTQTWDFSGTSIVALNDGDQLFINASLPFKY